MEAFVLKPKVAIEDAGEVLEGAAKMLWAGFKPLLAYDYDILGMDYKKSEHFPKIPYERLLKDGVDANILAAIKAAEFTITSKPRLDWKKYRWNEDFRQLMVFVKVLLEKQDLSVADIISVARGVSAFPGLTDSVKLGMELGFPFVMVMGRASISYYNIAERYCFFLPNGRIGDIDGFPTYDEALLALRQRLMEMLSGEPSTKARSSEKKGQSLGIWRTKNTGLYLIGYKGAVSNPLTLKGGFSSAEEARRHLTEHHDELQRALLDLQADKNYWDADLTLREGIDWVEDGTEITSDYLLAVVGFRGIQYGNYTTQTERLSNNLLALNGFYDLADVLDVHVSELSFDGTLGFAYGARGKGKRTGVAHFESVGFNINLTRKNGRGSFSHEFGHAVDAFLGAIAKTGYISHQRVGVFATDVAGRAGSLLPSNIDKAVANYLLAIGDTDIYSRSYMKDSAKKGKRYWSTRREIFARCFERWVQYELNLKNRKNGWLGNMSRVYEADSDYPYPTVSEMEILAPKFRALFSEIRKCGGFRRFRTEHAA